MSASGSIGKWVRRIVVLALFAALVLVLLWFQGIIGRPAPKTVAVPGYPRLAPGAKTALARETILKKDLVYPAFVQAVDPIEVSSRVMAEVKSVAPREGDSVTKGQVLLTLDDADAKERLKQAKAAVDEARANAKKATRDFDRADRLKKVDTISEQEWEAARAARDATAAALDRAEKAQAEAATALTWYVIESPVSGRVLERNVEPGDMASPGRLLLTLYTKDRLRLRAAVPEARAGNVHVGEKLEVRWENCSAMEKVTRILPSADPGTGTVTIRLSLDPSMDLRPGRYLRLSLPVGTRRALLVPAAAVTTIGQVERVLLVKDGRVEPATVRTGKRHGDDVEILSGLAKGDRVQLP